VGDHPVDEFGGVDANAPMDPLKEFGGLSIEQRRRAALSAGESTLPGVKENFAPSPQYSVPQRDLPDLGAGNAFVNGLTNLAGHGPQLMSALDATAEGILPEKTRGPSTWNERYQKYLRRSADMLDAGRQHHGLATFTGEGIGNLPLYGALPETAAGQVGGSAAIGAANAVGDTERQGFIDTGKQMPDWRQLLRSAIVGGTGGAMGGAIGYSAPRGVANQVGKGADFFTLRALGGERPQLSTRLQNVLPKDLPPGELALGMQEAGIVRPWSSSEQVSQRAGEATRGLTKQATDIRRGLDEAGSPGVKISDVGKNVQESAGDFVSGDAFSDSAIATRDRFLARLRITALAKKYGRSFDEMKGLVVTDPKMQAEFTAPNFDAFNHVTHQDYQHALANSSLATKAHKAYEKLRNPIHTLNPAEEENVAIYDGLRAAEDEAQGRGAEATGQQGESLRDIRRSQATMIGVRNVAKQRAVERKGLHPAGIWGMLGTTELSHALGHDSGALVGLGTLGAALAARHFAPELNSTAAWALSGGQQALRSLARTQPLTTMAAAQAGTDAAQTVANWFDKPAEPPRTQQPKKKQPGKKLQRSQPEPQEQAEDKPDLDEILDQVGDH
jgi:hypothetical protein